MIDFNALMKQRNAKKRKKALHPGHLAFPFFNGNDATACM
jgi:hypothetical protein